MTAHVELFNGLRMPIVGLGMSGVTNPEELEKVIDVALKAGYRHFDTAFYYGNEKVFGKILKKYIDSGTVKREELFITTKLPVMAMKPDRVEEFLSKSLTVLQLTYVDLYLVHFPIGLDYDGDIDSFSLEYQNKLVLDKTTNLEGIWKEMEKQVETGRANSIGISNYNSEQIKRMLKIAKIQPAILQVEMHVYFPQKPLRELCKKNNIIVTAYAPLGSPGRRNVGLTPAILNPIVEKVAKKYNKIPAQILLRFLTQQDVVVIPKSVTAERIQKNIQIFDFELDANDMALLNGLDQGPSGRSFTFLTVSPGVANHREYPFLLPY